MFLLVLEDVMVAARLRTFESFVAVEAFEASVLFHLIVLDFFSMKKSVSAL